MKGHLDVKIYILKHTFKDMDLKVQGHLLKQFEKGQEKEENVKEKEATEKKDVESKEESRK
jgi:hypothetical protein